MFKPLATSCRPKASDVAAAYWMPALAVAPALTCTCCVTGVGAKVPVPCATLAALMA